MWVDHHRQVDVVERAAIQQQDLPAVVAALLRRCPDDVHRQPQVVDEAGQRRPGSDRGARDDVVPASVSDGRKCVVSAQIATWSGPSPRVATKAVGISNAGLSNIESGRDESLGGPFRTQNLFERDLRVRVDPMTQLEKAVPQPTDGPLSMCL